MLYMTKEEVMQRLREILSIYFGCELEKASQEQLYKASAMVVRELLLEKRSQFRSKAAEQDSKQVYYLCMEFLVGRSLKNHLYNLGLTDVFREALQEISVDLEELYEQEPDAGLGNGGLGRLAACYMDSLATLGYAATGFSIRFEYGLFRQKLVDGWQIEMPDIWLPGGQVWLVPRTDISFQVRFNGRIEEQWTAEGLKANHLDYDEVEAVPYDMMISGENSPAVSLLRLWRARDIRNFDMESFANGDYARATLENTSAEMISKVLYPADNHFEGKSLRLKQQYFLVSASIQNIFHDYIAAHGSLEHFAERVAIHINDTHPALCIPEMMRILMDDYHYTWEAAFEVVKQTVAYTNHTVMAEALEKWPEDLLQRRLPRIWSILRELNERFCGELWQRYPGDWERIERMALLSKGQVRMANLCVVGSHTVNGVSALHSEILKKEVFRDFAELTPEKFTNVTNGIAHRRWLCQSNPGLTALLDECIGPDYRSRPEQLSRFLQYREDTAVLQRLENIKRENKVRFANRVAKETGIMPDPDSVFIVQAKRLHEYKRQLLNALRIISRYQQLLENPDMEMQPETYFFAAKAAPGYDMAKQIIKLISYLSHEIEANPKIAQKLRVIFLENYCATMAEHMMPAAEISEQISLAGKEGSGTGNMKLMINGALTMGTMDGANIEISQRVGMENIFIFGLRAEEVNEVWRQGYSPSHYYQQDIHLKQAVDRLLQGFGGVDFSNLHHYLMIGNYGVADPYMCMADFSDYCRAHELAAEVYQDRRRWNQMSLTNIACAGKFAADRAIREYAERIWKIKPVK